jgi:hypothetical protein
MIRKTLAVALLLVLSVSARAQAAVPDFRDYQSLLDKYVVRIGEKGQPLDTRFDYEQLYVDEKIWTLKRSPLLEQIHAQLLAAKPSAMKPAERLAWALNTYNFLVIEQVTVNLILPPKRNHPFSFIRYTSVDQIRKPQSGFFTTPLADVEGRSYTLESFERRFVYGDTSSGSGTRAPLADPRVRFAINPGRIGSPPLLPYAFHADSLDHQLDRVTRTALALPRFVTVQVYPPLLLVSDWLSRDPGDFGGTPQGMLAFVRKYGPRSLAEDLKKANLTSVSRYMQTDPKLNQKDHPKVVMPAPADSVKASR